MQRRMAMRRRAAAINAQARRLPVTRISLKARNAVANWSRIEMAKITVILMVFVPLYSFGISRQPILAQLDGSYCIDVKRHVFVLLLLHIL
jgi:hypothetical protein